MRSKRPYENMSDGHDGETEDEGDHDHGLPPEDLQYPEYVFESGEITEDGSR